MVRFHQCMPIAHAEGEFSCFVCKRDMAAEMAQYEPDGAKTPIRAGSRPSKSGVRRSSGWGSGGGARKLRLG